MAEPCRLWTLAEVRTYLRISDASLYRLLARGDMKKTKVGGRVLIRESELLRYVEKGPR